MLLTRFRRAALVLVFSVVPVSNAFASATDVYVASGAAGAANGSSCSNALGIGFFNDWRNWGSGAAQIGPGSTVHLCGTITAPAGASGFISFQASGAPGAPITLAAEPGAVLQAPFWGQYGAIEARGLNNVVIDGRGVGVIQATANGSNLANQAPNCGGNICTSAIYLLGCDSCTVSNWTISNMYVNVPPVDESPAGQGSAGILYNGGNDALISGNTIHDAKWCLMYGFFPDATTSNVRIAGNTIYNCDHGVFVSSDNSGAILNNIYIYGNTIHDGAIWDDNANENHHDGIHLSPSHPNTAINNSYLYNNHIYGDWGYNCNSFIYLAPAPDPGYVMTNANVFNNLLRNTSTVNTCWNGMILDYTTQNSLIANNTLIGSTSSSGQGILHEEVSPYRAQIRNNLLINLQNGFYVGPGYSFPDSDYNVFFNVANVAFVWGTACCTPLSEWQSQVGSPDMHGSTGNPSLSGAYVPQTGGSAALRGSNLSNLGMSALNADIVGTPRSASGAWDVGAFASGASAPVVTISVSPTVSTLGQGGQQQFIATVSNSALGVTWSLSPQVGTLSANGLYTAPGSITSQQTVQVTAAAGGVSATASVTLTPPAPPVTVSVSPTTRTLGQGGQQQFTATVSNSGFAVTWSMSPQVGTLSANGMYTAPNSISSQQTVQVTAAAGGASASASVTLTPPAPVTVSVSPTTSTLVQGGQQQFNATVSNSGLAVTWSMSPQVGTLSANGLYTAPSSIASQQSVQVTATAGGVSASASVTLTPPAGGSLTVSPTARTLGQGGQQQFIAKVSTGMPVTWSLSPQMGTLSANGMYTAPNTISSQQTVHVTATAGGASASAAVTLTPPVSVSVSVSPTASTLGQGAQQQFSATVSNPALPVTWSLSPQVGTLSANGRYTAPSSIANQQTVQVTATAGGVSASASVTLTPPAPPAAPVTISVSPTASTLEQGGQQQFSATVSNSALPVTWSLSPQVGTLSANGLYTAPSSIASQQMVQVTATAGGVSASALVTLVPAAAPVPVNITVSPAATTMSPGDFQQFTATVTGAAGGVTWSVSPQIGYVSSNGGFKAPSVTTPTIVLITAGSIANPSASASAVVTLLPRGSTQ